MCTKTPHKHADLIKAWADGATIQVQLVKDKWETISQPIWTAHVEYRIKPEPKPDYSVFLCCAKKAIGLNHQYARKQTGLTKDEFQIEIAFSGETNEILFVQLV